MLRTLTLPVYLLLILAGGVTRLMAFQEAPIEPIPPTDFHKVLLQDVGVWDAELKIYSDPAHPETPVLGKGVETNIAFGEYWLVSNLEFDMMGTKAHGHGIYGYDPITKKCVGSWMGSQNPFPSQLIGEYVAGNRTYYYKMNGRDPAGNEATGRFKVVHKDDDHRLLTMSIDTGEGEQQWMEIALTRRKDGESGKAASPSTGKTK